MEWAQFLTTNIEKCFQGYKDVGYRPTCENSCNVHRTFKHSFKRKKIVSSEYKYVCRMNKNGSQGCSRKLKGDESSTAAVTQLLCCKEIYSEKEFICCTPKKFIMKNE